MQKFAALVSYVGTQFCGWQRQTGSAAEGGPSIQATLENVLRKITREEDVSIVGSGRTDSGVHAVGQVAHFLLREKVWDPAILLRALNSQLPVSIRVLDVRPVAIDFHAQRSAEKKQYSYYFQQGPCAIPHLEPYSWWIHRRLDQRAMAEALGHLVGEHDFKPFQAAGSKPGPTVRRILEADVTFEPVFFPSGAVNNILNPFNTGFVRVRVLGTGFLKQMVRGIAGTLLQVGEGRREPGCTREILAGGNRSEVGPTAPARALWLEQVWYHPQFGLEWRERP